MPARTKTSKGPGAAGLLLGAVVLAGAVLAGRLWLGGGGRASSATEERAAAAPGPDEGTPPEREPEPVDEEWKVTSPTRLAHEPGAAPLDPASVLEEELDLTGVPADPLGDDAGLVDELQHTAGNQALPLGARVDALALLRRTELAHDLKRLRSSRTITSLVRLAEDEQDPALRARVLLESRGALEPWHKDPLLRLLADDAVVDVRIAAARALRELQKEASVREALVEASWNDPDERVRIVAEEAVQNWVDDVKVMR